MFFGINNHSDSEPIEHIFDKILPTCDSVLSYEFNIVFDGNFGDANSTSDFIAEILRTEGVKRCSNSNVKFSCHISSPTHLPIECISNWLQMPHFCGKMRKERIFDIWIKMELQNARQLCDHLKKV